ncbi:MAG: HD domain-containing protein [bacterium]
MKKLIKIALLFIACASVCNADTYKKTHINKREAYMLHDLIEDFKSYKTTNTSFHAGNLYEHSLWVTITINSWFKIHEEWTDGLDAHDQKIVLLAGLLHDVGKAGDQEFTFYTKPNHDTNGQDYIIGTKRYMLSNNKIFNFDKLFKLLKLSETDKKIVSILVGAHNEFGNLLRNASDVNLHEKFKNQLEPYAIKAGYTYPIDTKIMNMAILITAADVKGAREFDNKYPFNICEYTITKSPNTVHGKKTENKFQNLDYETRGKKYRALILNR